MQQLQDMEGEPGIDRVDQDGPAPQVGVGGDVGLNAEPREAVVAADHDRDIGPGRVGERHRVVGGRVDDRVATLKHALSQLDGIGRDLDVHIEPASGKKSPGLSRQNWQVLQALKNHDGEPVARGLRILGFC